ncbi:RNA-binding S1 domain-containing protein [Galdieria sulphuraria]|uniref:RNA-binding S1 domain-containing protein n=1 Tax=Galdieria sulphuraria TaxID=130081 RepID=M2XPK1_GALSU|nr:RNA-binding S1 domain-containing protein [Galdieria sulphuraria]EME32142.1 RNA-binding S1 domain-containing protein [Galdieria sulphuraria]|eukprot:XP_005708662.1 RNA-binding S1 domain-containing protein [Galdieria sulphuraria]
MIGTGYVSPFSFLQVVKYKKHYLLNTTQFHFYERREFLRGPVIKNMPLPRHRSLTWRPVRACETGTQSLERFGNHKSPKESERIPLSQLRFNVLYEGTVTKLLKYGFLVDIGAQKNAIVHISEVKAGYVANLRNDVKLGQRVFVVLLGIKPMEGRIEASVKAAQKMLAAGIYDVEISRLKEWGSIERLPYKEVCGGIDNFYQDEDFTEVFLKTRRYT